ELEIIVEGAETVETGSTEFYSYKSADYEAINAFFGQHETLSTINQIGNLENAFDIFSNVVRNAVNEFVPKVRVEKSTDSPWYTKDLKHLNNIRRKEYSRAKESKNVDAYNAATDAFMQLQGQLFESYINRIQSQIKSDQKHFWRFVNDRRKRNELPSVIEYNNETASTDESKAQLFAEYFKNQYTACDDIDLDELLNECTNDPFEIEISEPDVLKALQSMKVNKGSGPDGISPHILKNCAQTLAKPLSVLFCKSLEQGIVPDSLKTSRIRPVFKSGSKNNAANYRPIVIIPSIAKVFETVIYDKIGAYVNGKVIQNQHGFVKNRSTTTNLMQTLNYTFEAMTKKQMAIILYTDFEKAFDRVNHRILLQKLARFGFGRATVKWFHAYLTSRNQFVGVNGKESRTFAVTSGVPAGSILGPCLFIIFINDITNSVTHALVVL
ncbi:MAG: reverse transcriptase family protein, partial [Sphingobacteriaceae bacterium]